MDYYDAKADEYLDYAEQSKPFKNTQTRADYRQYILSAMEFMTSAGYEAPTEEYYEALKAKLSDKYSPSTIQKKILPPVRKFFAWTKERLDISPIHEADNAPNADNAPAKKNRGGRPRKTDADTGEDYSKKVTVYISPSLEADLRMLAEAKSTNINGYIRDLIIADRNSKREKIQALQGVKELYERGKTAYLEALRNL